MIQLNRYIQVIAHVIGSPVVWLLVAISTIEPVMLLITGGSNGGLSLVLLVLSFYLGTGLFYNFARGEYRVSTAMAFERARSVIIPVLLLSLKLGLFWMLPSMVILILTTGGEAKPESMQPVMLLIMLAMVISFVLVTATAMVRERYELLPNLKLVGRNLNTLLMQSLVAISFSIACFIISFAIAPTSPLQIIILPLTAITEYACFLYVVGVLNSDERMQQQLKSIEGDDV